MTPTYLTLSGIEKLKGELDYLRNVKRQEIAALLSESNGGHEIGGDSDPEFAMTKQQQQAFIEGRIQELEILLSNTDIIDDHLHGDIVDIGSLVTISDNDLSPMSYTT